MRLGPNEADKQLADIDITGAIVVSVDKDSKAAKDRSRTFIGLYLSLFPNIAQETGLPDDLVSKARAAFHEGGPEAAARHIDDNVVDYLTASGTPEECRSKIAEYRAAGLQEPILFPLDPNVQMAVETLGPNNK